MHSVLKVVTCLARLPRPADNTHHSWTENDLAISSVRPTPSAPPSARREETASRSAKTVGVLVPPDAERARWARQPL